MGGGHEADGTISGAESEQSRRPPPRPIVKPRILVGFAAAVVAILGVVGVVVLTTGSDELRADGAFITNAGPALRAAEAITEGFAETSHGGGDVAGADDVDCWFAYADGEETPEELWCGPVMFADSPAGSHWLTMPVTFRPDDDTAVAEPGFVQSRRTLALPDDIDLRRPDGANAPADDAVDLERPDAPQADPATVSTVPDSEVMVDLEEPDDGRLRGVGYSWEITGAATTDRVHLPVGESDQGTIKAAAEGEEWLLFQLATDTSSSVLADTTLEVAVVADDVSTPVPIDDTSLVVDTNVIAVSVPEDAEDVTLVVNDGHLAQTWSFGEESRSGGAEVLYRDEDERIVEVDQEFALPFGIRDLNPIPGLEPVDLGEYGYIPGTPGYDSSRPFGDLTLNLRIGGARLDYAIESRSSGAILTTFHSAGAPDRAFVFLTDVEAEWSELGYGEYLVPPVNAVLTLPDGTQITATRPGGEPEWGGTLDVGLDGTGRGSGSGLAWNVPADLEKATVTLTFPTLPTGLDEVDFHDATVSFDLDFGQR